MTLNDFRDDNDEDFYQYAKRMKNINYIEGRFEKIYIDEPFNFKRHKDNFIHYLEVVILPNGEIKYAVPDHKHMLIRICNLTEDEMKKNRELFILDNLIEKSKCICVYTNYYRGKANDKQLKILSSLKDYGLYYGELKEVC